jgi:hypothetical protein
MKRSIIALVAVVMVAVPAVVYAATAATTPIKRIGGTFELGVVTTPVAPPVCPPGVLPANCTIILTRATGLETIRDGTTYPTTIKRAGTLVAFTIGLAQLATTAATAHTEIASLDAKYGGVTQAGITVLKPAPGKNPTRTWTVVAQSPMFHLQPYLGYTVEFPLTTPIPVVRGETIALTVPTWAPVLSYNLPTRKFAYRQSRSANCLHPGGLQNAQLTVNQSASYMCDYPGTRVEYSATEIVVAPPPTNYVH